MTLEERVINFSLKVWLKKNWKVLVVLTLLVCVAYGNSLNNYFVSDDGSSILLNKDIEKPSYFLKGNTFNLRSLFYFVINKVFGRNPVFFRLVNILFHIGVVFLVFLLLSILIDSKAAFFSSAILAVHPVLTESVTWISGGAYPQYSFFLMLSLLAYILSYKNNKLFLISVASFILGIFSSLLVVFFPVILLLFVVSFDSLRRARKKLLVFFVIGGALAIVCLFKVVDRLTEFQTLLHLEPQTYSPLLYIPVAITSYLELIFWPKGLTLFHAEMVLSQADYIARLVIFALFLGAVVYSYRRSRHIFFWSSFFVISLLPMLVPSDIHFIVAERYVYLGSIGIFTIIGLWLGKLWETKKIRIFVGPIFCLIIIALSVRTIMRNIDWKNEDNLCFASVKTSPGSSYAHISLGNVYSKYENFEKAISEYKTAIKIKPDYVVTYNNLGLVYSDAGEYEEAIAYYKKAISVNSQYAGAYVNLCVAYEHTGRYEEAINYCREALQINPELSEAHYNLAIIYYNQGSYDLAIEHCDKAVELGHSINPKLTEALEPFRK